MYYRLNYLYLYLKESSLFKSLSISNKYYFSLYSFSFKSMNVISKSCISIEYFFLVLSIFIIFSSLSKDNLIYILFVYFYILKSDDKLSYQVMDIIYLEIELNK